MRRSAWCLGQWPLVRSRLFLFFSRGLSRLWLCSLAPMRPATPSSPQPDHTCMCPSPNRRLTSLFRCIRLDDMTSVLSMVNILQLVLTVGFPGKLQRFSALCHPGSQRYSLRVQIIPDGVLGDIWFYTFPYVISTRICSQMHGLTLITPRS